MIKRGVVSRSGPIYRQCGKDPVSYVLETVVWWVFSMGPSAHFSVAQDAVYIIDKEGVRRKHRRFRVEVVRAKK